MRPLRVLVVDDEQPARQRLERLLAKHADVELAGSYGNPHDAVKALCNEPIDLTLLDVQMPELTGLDVVRSVGPERMPVTIFVTAYHRYAIRAFDVAAVDYLLKPFDDERFEQALSRAREQIRLRQVNDLAGQLRTLLDATTAAPAPAAASAPERHSYLERIAVEVRGQRIVVRADQIDYITAEGPYVELHVKGETLLVRDRMHLLEEKLNPDRFCRIHRSTIVNVERIAALEPLFRGDHLVKLRDGTILKLSRSRRDELARRLGVTF